MCGTDQSVLVMSTNGGGSRMAIRVRDARDNQWMVGKDFVRKDFGWSDSKLSQFSEHNLNTPTRVHEPGSESTLQCFEVDFHPGRSVEVHSHATDEIIYVLKGSLELGKRSLGPGSSVFVGADTLYSFRAGPDGLQFLNFRPHKDNVYRTREEHLAYMKEKANAALHNQQSPEKSE